jgi:hypothetical protein
MPQHVFHHQAGEVSATRAVFEADSVTAACFAVRRDAFFQVGGFDDGYQNGLEDIDLCLKIRSAGGRIVYRGDVSVVHHEGASRGRGQELHATPEKLAISARNDERFIARWASLIEQDDELAAAVWGGLLRDGKIGQESLATAMTIVVGQPTGIGAGADEARALVEALTIAGRRPAAIDLPVTNVVAKLSEPLATIIRDAGRRRAGPDPTIIYVPAGDSDVMFYPGATVTPSPGSIVRLGTPRTALSLEHARVLAASQAVVAQLEANGLEPARISVMPPLLMERSAGRGGEGILAILPVRDPATTTSILTALRDRPRGAAVRLLPTAFDRRLAAAVADAVPGAELLSPCSDEEQFVARASCADLVVVADSSDPFDRHALTAAAVGTQPLTLNIDGPAQDVLGPGVATTMAGLARRIVEFMVEPTERGSLQELVRAMCDLSAIDRYLERPGRSIP